MNRSKLAYAFLLFMLLSGCKKEEALGSVADIEDARFLSYVLNKFDTNDDALLSNDEIMAVKVIDCSAMGVRSLKGIEMFRNLEILNCSNNLLENLDVSKNTKLSTILCQFTSITALDVSNNILLTDLSCYFNGLTTLDLSKNINLKKLNCQSNSLISIDLSKNINLEMFLCGINDLTSLDLSNLKNLIFMHCGSNKLTSLDLSSNLSLGSISCPENPDLKVLYMSKDNVDCEIEKDAHTELVYK